MPFTLGIVRYGCQVCIRPAPPTPLQNLFIESIDVGVCHEVSFAMGFTPLSFHLSNYRVPHRAPRAPTVPPVTRCPLRIKGILGLQMSFIGFKSHLFY